MELWKIAYTSAFPQEVGLKMLRVFSFCKIYNAVYKVTYL